MVAAMKRFPSLSVPVIALALAGCGEESAVSPVDGREFDGDRYAELAPYTGRVIDGYLKNARVWLDMDGDSQYTSGPMLITLDNGNEVVLESGEPTAMSGAGGRFSLDISEFEISADVGPNLDPRDYPLFALILPGKTLEEAHSGDVPVEGAYMLSAAPGVRNVTPLSMLARFRRMFFLPDFSGSSLPEGLSSLNLVRDYIQAGDEQAHAYAQTFARFLASQFPESYSGVLEQANANGTERFLSEEAAHLLGISLVKYASTLVDLVDNAALQGGYPNVDIKALSLPGASIDLNDPVLVTGQRIYAYPSSQSNLPISGSSLDESAQLTFFYSEDGRIQSVDVDGCIVPSMAELARLVKHNGYMAELDTQWMPSVSLAFNESLMQFNNDREVDERLEFDWDNQRILFDSATTCHQNLGIEAGSELGGVPEVTYIWEFIGGEVKLVSQMRGANDSLFTREYVTNSSSAVHALSGFSLSDSDGDIASLDFVGGVSACPPPAESDAGASHLVSAYQPYAFTTSSGSLDNAVSELDVRSFGIDLPSDSFGVQRLLRFGFLDQDMAGLPNVNVDSGFEWQMFYEAVEGPGFVPEQPNLIAKAELLRYAGVKGCSRVFEPASSGLFASVRYSYQRLSDHLIGRLQ
ncbi:hypothetical protein QVZ43_15070 [Marinobacter sp. chi1]|uniref:Uncharacterized protein n=1 Tax=Marinobacter suaedae TaxID=3057675 RepID=A0ABT8W474_9GAMM|nr:hypothetical protein [Marinobacter sp. chi1]MDO3723043.1 hypothetical protein [Marinobacter sp. chi1]